MPGTSCSASQIRFEERCDGESAILGILQDMMLTLSIGRTSFVQAKFSGTHGDWGTFFPSSADHEQDWQPYPVDPYSAICDDHTYILRTSISDGITLFLGQKRGKRTKPALRAPAPFCNNKNNQIHGKS